MADKSGPAAAGRVPTADRPADLRNVALVGPTTSGKTTLTEALLFGAGVISRMGQVEDGTTVSDFDEAETKQKRSVNLTVAPFQVDGTKVNLLDTPGYADFLGDQRAGIQGADAALFCVSGVEGVDARARMAWEECASAAIPRAIVVTKLDHHRADFSAVVAQCREAFGNAAVPAFLPITTGDDESSTMTGIVGLLSGRCTDHSSGEARETTPPAEMAEEIESAREALIEAIIEGSEDEELMEGYLSGSDVTPEMLLDDLRAAVARGGLYPIVPVAAQQGVGIAELLREIPLCTPAPKECPLPESSGRGQAPQECDVDAPLMAQVLKTISDPYVGRISLVRVYSGVLRSDSMVHIIGTAREEAAGAERDATERIGAVSVPLGKQTRPAGEAVAGDICAVAKLANTQVGDTLTAPEQHRRIAPWALPQPLLPVALRADSKADEDKLAQAMSKLGDEDMTLRTEVNAETHQLVLWCMGEAHRDVVMDRLTNRYGVAVHTEPVRVPLRETFAVPAQGMGRNVKQTGGHGEYGICHIEVEPLPSGAGLEFVDKIVGGVVPRQYIPSVEKGVRMQMEQGVTTGHPLVDIRVTLYDGKSHSVDSSDMAFQKAGKLALKDAADKSRVAMLEPIDEVTVLVSDEYVGPVMSDLSSRRGRVLGSEPVGTGRTLIRAEVPELEITRYAIDLRSLAHGTGSFNREYKRYEPLPAHLAEQLAKQAAEEGGS